MPALISDSYFYMKKGGGPKLLPEAPHCTIRVKEGDFVSTFRLNNTLIINISKCSLLLGWSLDT